MMAQWRHSVIACGEARGVAARDVRVCLSRAVTEMHGAQCAITVSSVSSEIAHRT